MKEKKIDKQQLFEKNRNENRKFNRIMLKSFGLMILILVLIQVFYTYGCDTKFLFREYYLFQKEISPEMVCMTESRLKYHKSKIYQVNNQDFSICGKYCKTVLTNYFTKISITLDAFSHEQITKSTAIIGLKKKGNPELVYFKNKQNFEKYYEQ